VLLYNFDPEELFLFSLTKCCHGYGNKEMCINVVGGNEKRWSYGFPWMLIYVDQRCQNIIEHQCLLRYVHQFPQFHQAMEREMQLPKTHYDTNNNPIHTDGLLFIPFLLDSLIDGLHNAMCRPYSGPAGETSITV
jgi:hypothetical protein